MSADIMASSPGLATTASSPLTRLPLELINSIFSALDLAALHSVGKTSRQFAKLLREEATIWSSVLPLEAENVGVHAVKRFDATRVDPNTRSRTHALLATLGASRISPPPVAWIHFLPVLSRDFVLFEAELPSLTDDEWMAVCRHRFPLSIVRREFDEQEKEDNEGLWRRQRWRHFFLRTLGKLEHRDETFCIANDHHIRYVILHRKWGLCRNRLSSREFDPIRVFEELKKQNGLADLLTVQVSLPPQYCPTDIQISVFLTIGKTKKTISNEIAMDLLDRLGSWRREGNTHSILGPTLVTATIRRSPHPRRQRGALPLSYVSVELSDFLALTAKVGADERWWRERDVQFKDGDGFA